MQHLSRRSQDASAHRFPRGDLIVLGLVLAGIAAVIGVGYLLNQEDVPIYAATAPIYGVWMPHVGPGTLPALLTAVAVIVYGPTLAARLSWRRLLGAGYLGALLWTFALAMVDGWQRGIADRLTGWTEYLHDVPRVTDIGMMLREFTDHVLAGQPESWTVHVSGHPPGVLLFYVILDRIGLGGGAWGGIMSVLIGSLAAVAVPVTVRSVADSAAARAAVPFAVLFPGAVWVGVSGDGMFAGVVATGVALLAVGAARRTLRGDLAAFAGGLVLGWGIFLNYGLVLMAPLALVVVLLNRRWRPLLLGVAGALTVVCAFALAGFWWWEGYELVIQRYDQGAYALRPYSYWVWGNFGALLISAGPVAAVLARRAMVAGTQQLRSARDQVLLGITGLVVAATLAVLVADLSGLSKAEVERIWLPFAVWFAAGAVLLPARHRRWWLVVQAVTALAVNHLVVTNW